MGVEGYDKVYTKVIEGKPKCVYKRPNGTKHYVLGFGKMRTIENYVKLCRKKAVEKAAKSKKVTKKPSTRKRYGGFFQELFTGIEGNNTTGNGVFPPTDTGIKGKNTITYKGDNTEGFIPIPFISNGKGDNTKGFIPIPSISNGKGDGNEPFSVKIPTDEPLLPTKGGNSCNRGVQRKQKQQLQQQQQQGGKRKKKNASNKSLLKMMMAAFKNKSVKKSKSKRRHHRGGEGEGEGGDE